MQETQEIQVRCLGLEDPVEQEMATHSSILAWEIPRTEAPGGLQSIELDMTERLSVHAGMGGGSEAQEGGREGTHVYFWPIHVVWQKPTQCYKAITLQLNIKF